jgi:hypothetical protein
MKIIDYKVVYAQSNPNINEVVNALIKEGWQPLGPCMPAVDKHSGTFDQQTMVKYEEQSK